MNFEKSLKTHFNTDEELNKVQLDLNKRDIILKIIRKLLKLYQLNQKFQIN